MTALLSLVLWLCEHAPEISIGLCVLVVLAIVLAPRRPEPVVGRLLAHHDPSKRPTFTSTRS